MKVQKNETVWRLKGEVQKRRNKKEFLKHSETLEFFVCFIYLSCICPHPRAYLKVDGRAVKHQGMEQSLETFVNSNICVGGNK